MEEKIFSRIVISFFVLLTFVFSYYMGYFSARLGITPLGVGSNPNNQQVQGTQKQGPVSEVSYVDLVGDELAIGNKDSSIQLIEFNDFECPFCARFHVTLEKLLSKNNDIEVFTKHFPLSFHENAKTFAIMFECIGQNKSADQAYAYIKEHFQVIRDSQSITEDESFKIAEKFGLNNEMLDNCSKDEKIASKIERDFQFGSKNLNIGGTPAIVVQNKETKKAVLISGAVPENIVQAEIDKLKQ